MRGFIAQRPLHRRVRGRFFLKRAKKKQHAKANQKGS